jgi:hypothetical protein
MRAFKFRDGGVGIDADEQGVAEVAGGFEIGDVAEVEDVEAAVGDDELFMLGAKLGAPSGEFFPRDEVIAKVH